MVRNAWSPRKQMLLLDDNAALGPSSRFFFCSTARRGRQTHAISSLVRYHLCDLLAITSSCARVWHSLARFVTTLALLIICSCRSCRSCRSNWSCSVGSDHIRLTTIFVFAFVEPPPARLRGTDALLHTHLLLAILVIVAFHHRHNCRYRCCFADSNSIDSLLLYSNRS